MALDDRGSKLQRLLYDLTVEAYPQYEVIHEYPIGALRQRIDIFIPLLGIAVEADGIQHDQFVSFFHKDEVDWNYSVLLDTKKTKYLVDRGVKIVRFPHDTKISTAQELLDIINSVPYPDVPYEGIEMFSEAKKQRIAKEKEFRKVVKESRKKYDY